MSTNCFGDFCYRSRIWYIRDLYLEGYWRFQFAGKRIAENGIFCFLGELFLGEGEGIIRIQQLISCFKFQIYPGATVLFTVRRFDDFYIYLLLVSYSIFA